MPNIFHNTMPVTLAWFICMCLSFASQKICSGSGTYNSLQEGDLFKRCFSMSSSLAEAAATTSAETPARALEDRVRDDNEGDVSALLGDFAMLHAQQSKNTLQKVVDVAEEPENSVTGCHVAADGTPFFQRNMRRTTTMPNGSIAGKVMLLNGSVNREPLQVAGTGSLPECAPQPKGDLGVIWTPTASGRNGRCVRIDTNALAAAVVVRQDYGNVIAGNDMTALLGDLKLLQEASATVQSAGCSAPAGDPNAFFQRNNRRTTTLPGTMANVKIRASALRGRFSL